MTDDYAIEATDLRKVFGDTVAVDSLSLKVPKGKIYGLIGPDGAGKSTTIRMLATILEPTSGDAHVAGHSIVTQSEAIKPRVGYMPEEFTLYRDLTVMENLNFFADLFGVTSAKKRERTEQLLAFSRLQKFTQLRAENLSGGMKQKLALACTLIHEPDILFLDEPTTGVDPVSRRDFWRILSDLHARGVTMFIATPYMDEAERCSSVAFMENGKIILEDTPSRIKARLQGGLVEIKADPLRPAMAMLQKNGLVSSVDMYGELLQVRVDSPAEALPELEDFLKKNGIRIEAINPARVSMESAFIDLLKTRRDPR
jgi:ABC-2 type transport system ATP-binding protein